MHQQNFDHECVYYYRKATHVIYSQNKYQEIKYNLKNMNNFSAESDSFLKARWPLKSTNKFVANIHFNFTSTVLFVVHNDELKWV